MVILKLEENILIVVRRWNMKKVVLVTALVILIPYLIVTLFMKEEELKFYYDSNKIVRVKREATGVIERIPFELYVKGVLAGEMPANFEEEALKAQAVAARSYVLKKMEQNKDNDYDIVDTVSNQVYLSDEDLKNKWKIGYVEKMNKITTAVTATTGEYLAYNGAVAEAFFFSTSSGKTENCEEVFSEKLPYLRSVNSEWDAEVSPVFEETHDYTLTNFYQTLGLPYQKSLVVAITETTSTGRVKKLTINGKEFTGSDVYQKFKLRSTFFKIEQSGEKVIITTKGYGHGVGMSQYGAEAMAKKGYKYDEILKHYYQGIQIKKI